MQPAPRPGDRRRPAPARGPVRAVPGAGAVRPPAIEPSEPRVVDGGHRSATPTSGDTEEPAPDRQPADASTVSNPSDPSGPSDPVGPSAPALDAALPVRPGRGAEDADELASTRFSPAATWPAAQDGQRRRPPSLFSTIPPDELFDPSDDLVIDLRDDLIDRRDEHAGEPSPLGDRPVETHPGGSAEGLGDEPSAGDRPTVAPGDAPRG
ncbi:MAG: hypothetical protein R2755_33460 [Acidimicrobiales bacterium]